MSHAPCLLFGFGRLYDRGMAFDEYQYQIKSGGTNLGYLVQFKRQRGPYESLQTLGQLLGYSLIMCRIVSWECRVCNHTYTPFGLYSDGTETRARSCSSHSARMARVTSEACAIRIDIKHEISHPWRVPSTVFDALPTPKSQPELHMMHCYEPLLALPSYHEPQQNLVKVLACHCPSVQARNCQATTQKTAATPPFVSSCGAPYAS